MNVRVVVVREGDGVGVCVDGASPGDVAGNVTVLDTIPPGHKVALRDHASGEYVVKYGESIGVATRAIRAGEHVHSHNLHSARAVV